MRLDLVGVAADQEDDEAGEDDEHRDAGNHALARGDAGDTRCDARGERVNDRREAADLGAEDDDHDRGDRIEAEGQDDGHEHQEVDDAFLIGAFERTEERHQDNEDGDQRMHVVLIGDSDALDGRLERAGAIHHLE